MATNLDTDPMDEDFKLWKRMIERRRKDCQHIDEERLEEIVREPWEREVRSDESDPCDALSKLEKVLLFHLRIVSDDEKPAKRRRHSLDLVQSILRKVDRASGRTSKDPSNAILSESTNQNSSAAKKNKGAGSHSNKQSNSESVQGRNSTIREEQTNSRKEQTAPTNETTTIQIENGTLPGVHASSSNRSSANSSRSIHESAIAQNNSAEQSVRSSETSSQRPPRHARITYDDCLRDPTLHSFSENHWQCRACNCEFKTIRNLLEHVNGKKHQERLSKQTSGSHIPTDLNKLQSHHTNNWNRISRSVSPNSVHQQQIQHQDLRRMPSNSSQPAIRTSGHEHLTRDPASRVFNDGLHHENDSNLHNQRNYSLRSLSSGGTKEIQDKQPGTDQTPRELNSNSNKTSHNANAGATGTAIKATSANEDKISLDTIKKVETAGAANPPLASAELITVTANEDKCPTVSRSLKERKKTVVRFRPLLIDSSRAIEVGSRLREWDPFWRNLKIAAVGLTSTVMTLQPKPDPKHEHTICRAAHSELKNLLQHPEMLDLPTTSWGYKPNRRTSVGLILRMLPSDPKYYKKKRADCHMWPKGTLLQVDEKTIPLVQRRQQDHDPTQWKGMCNDIDLVEFINNPKEKHTVSIFTFDSDSYFYAIGICRYRSVDAIYAALMDTSGLERITMLSKEQGMIKALSFAGSEMLVIDSDDETEKGNTGKFVFSLTCPISKQPMKTPVRGKNCKHYQCCDLRNYIASNEVVSGSRWRCASCENFVSLQELEYCGLTRSLLVEFESVLTQDRDRIEFCADRTYRLLGEKKCRYKKQGNTNETSTGRLKKQAEEVIDLL